MYYEIRNLVVRGVIKLFYYLWYCTPQAKAISVVAFEDYRETVMYRERLIHFGEQFANDSYVEFDEYKLFINRISLKRKLAIFIMPYSYL
jgi:hypothetical protein